MYLSFNEINIPLLIFVGFINLLFFYSIIYDQPNFEENEDDNKDELEKPGQPIKTKPLPYEEKYITEYRKRILETQETQEKRNLKNSFLIEKTPLGNVAMYFNPERECFEYYSDNTIPYRYLETVGRKYVLTFDCLSLYVDMEEELKKQKRKIEEEQQKRQEEQEQEKQKKKIKTDENQSLENHKEEKEQNKKSVFAKLKNYNKSSNPNQSSAQQATRPNTSLEIPDKQTPQQLKQPNTIQLPKSNGNTNKPIILKERTNSYLSKGRFSNLQFIQSVKKEIVDKNFKMSFKDFKQITNNK
jgi:hypothetical protein